MQQTESSSLPIIPEKAMGRALFSRARVMSLPMSQSLCLGTCKFLSAQAWSHIQPAVGPTYKTWTVRGAGLLRRITEVFPEQGRMRLGLNNHSPPQSPWFQGLPHPGPWSLSLCTVWCVAISLSGIVQRAEPNLPCVLSTVKSGSQVSPTLSWTPHLRHTQRVWFAIQ